MIADLINGKSSFAIWGADEIIKARANGIPIVAIAVIYQRNPWVYVSLKGSGIERVQNIVGKKNNGGTPGHESTLCRAQ